ncbi:MAG TPA: hypothetical protein VGP82_19945 [Ktedonobacterales bacterium]|jgi:uncharacterized cupredoxin-like copper-binding protein|nr:hypothetical protein [Ktedonobacterales bacterium]
MTKMRAVHVLLMVVLLATTGLAGCASTAAVPEVKVTEIEFRIDASQTQFNVGKTYRFVVTNRGEIGHEFLLIPPEDDLPQLSTVDQLYSYGRAYMPDIPPGATKTIDYTFKQSDRVDLEMACYYPGQHDAGMYLAITVT